MNWLTVTLCMAISACLTLAVVYFVLRRKGQSDVPAVALNDGEKRMDMVVEAAPIALIVVDVQGAIVLVNAQAEAVFGYARDELIGQPVEMLVPDPFKRLHEDYRNKYLTAPEVRAMGSGRELFGRRRNGDEIPIEVGLNPIHSSGTTSVLVSVIDITERRRSERESLRQRSELSHLSRVAMLGEMSGSLAHELNQPLTAILSNAQAAQEFMDTGVSDPEEVRAILKDVVHDCRRAGEVIRRLRLLFQHGETPHEEVDLNELIVEVLWLMNFDLVSNGVALELELGRELPKISGDRVQLQQVLINLIVNASDAMLEVPSGQRRLSVSTKLDDGSVHMRVADTGSGIPPEGFDRIFEAFHTTKQTGMGLGLAVCRTIVSAHSGKIWGSNNNGRGACFHVTFPAMAVSVT